MAKLEERMALRETGGRRFHRERTITVKVLDLTVFALTQGTKLYRLYKERRRPKDVAEKGDLRES